MTKEQFAAMAKNFFFAFPKFVSNNQIAPYHKYICDRVQASIEAASKRRKKKLIIFTAPPRHGKSQLVGVHLPPWFLGHYPNKEVVISAYASGLSEEHSSKGKDIFEKWGPTLFDVKPHPDKFSKTHWHTEQGGSVLAVGKEGGTTGFGADLFIIDDYHASSKEAESASQRESVWSWWQSVITTRLHPGATVIICAVQWHHDDLQGRLKKQIKQQGKNFPFEYELIHLPAIAEEEDDILKRKKGEALWPWWQDESQLKDIENTVGPYVWAALYQGRPTSRGGTLFKSKYFRYYTFDYMTKEYICYRQDEREPLRIKKFGLIIRAYVDPALEIKEINDPTGIAIWGYSRKHQVWLLLDRFNEKVPHTQMRQTILMFAFKNNASMIGVENEKIGKIIVKQSVGKDYVGNTIIPFREVKIGKGDKYARASVMASYGETERVFFPREAPWLAAYEDCLVKFPSSAHDEDVDITSLAAEMQIKSSVAEALARNYGGYCE